MAQILVLLHLFHALLQYAAKGDARVKEPGHIMTAELVEPIFDLIAGLAFRLVEQMNGGQFLQEDGTRVGLHT